MESMHTYMHTFAPVARLQTIRLLCALAVELGLKIHQVDITTAYLNGYLDEEVIMQPSELLTKMLKRLIQEEGQTKIGDRALSMLKSIEAGGNVCKLRKALYGLKQAGRKWHERLTDKLKTLGLQLVQREPCLYYAIRKNVHLIVVIYVDVLLIASQNIEWIQQVKRDLKMNFELKDFGPVSYCLGIKIAHV